MTSPTQPQIRTAWPQFITAGASFKINRSFPEFGSTDWNYSLLFAGAAVANFNAGPQISVGPDASSFSVALTPDDTQKLNPSGGQSLPYTYVERLTAIADGEIRDIRSGRIMVEPNLAMAAPGDMVSFEERTLAVLELAIAGRLTSDVENYSIAGRSVSKIPARELLTLRGQFKSIVWRQRNPGKLTQTVDVALRPLSYPLYGPFGPRLLP